MHYDYSYPEEIPDCVLTYENRNHKIRYIVVVDFMSTYYYEFRAVVIYDSICARRNAYVLELGGGLYECQDPNVIVNNAKPLSLEIAKKNFPSCYFTEDNYGF
jgi:hypothetical protein